MAFRHSITRQTHLNGAPQSGFWKAKGCFDLQSQPSSSETSSYSRLQLPTLTSSLLTAASQKILPRMASAGLWSRLMAVGAGAATGLAIGAATASNFALTRDKQEEEVTCQKNDGFPILL